MVLDVRDTDALRATVMEAEPEVVINQLTSLPDKINYRKPAETFDANNELRGTVGPALAGIAAEAGTRRLITQSVCFFYASTGKRAHGEDDPQLELPPEAPMSRGFTAAAALERSTLETPGLEGVVLRYGYLYGPEVGSVPGGFEVDEVRRRRYPIVGDGTGIFSILHVEDAASAAVAAVERGAPGIYNVCDDDPAPLAEWLPVCAEAHRRQAAAARSGLAGEPDRRQAGGGDGDPARGCLEREGQARAGLAAEVPELAPGLSRGARLVALEASNRAQSRPRGSPRAAARPPARRARSRSSSSRSFPKLMHGIHRARARGSAETAS